MNIVSIESCIPTMEELQRRGKPPAERVPKEHYKAEIAEYLATVGYRPDNPEVWDAIVNYGALELEYPNRQGLFIAGTSGVGKTYGVQALAMKFKWAVIPATAIESVFMDDDKKEYDRLIACRDFFGKPLVLVIDDLGTESYPLKKYGTDYNLLADVLDFRYHQAFSRWGVKTIVTSNLDDRELRERYGYRIDDRMNEMFVFATVGGRSLR